jgi:hypothetical protein
MFVLAVAVVAVLQLVGGSLRLASASADHVAATLLATAKLSEVGAEALEEGETGGEEGDYRWTRRVAVDRELLPLAPGVKGAETVRLARVSVEVEWGKNRRVELLTLRAWAAKP